MGIFKNILLGALGAKTYQNVYNRPIVIPPSGYVVRSMKQKGIGPTWIVRYSKEDSLNVTSQFTISKGTRAMNIGANKFTVDWP